MVVGTEFKIPLTVVEPSHHKETNHVSESNACAPSEGCASECK